MLRAGHGASLTISHVFRIDVGDWPFAFHQRLALLTVLRSILLFRAAFSQAEFWHLASNMFTLYFFGTTVELVFGPRLVIPYLFSHTKPRALTLTCTCKHAAEFLRHVSFCGSDAWS